MRPRAVTWNRLADTACPLPAQPAACPSGPPRGAVAPRSPCAPRRRARCPGALRPALALHSPRRPLIAFVRDGRPFSRLCGVRTGRPVGPRAPDPLERPGRPAPNRPQRPRRSPGAAVPWLREGGRAEAHGALHMQTFLCVRPLPVCGLHATSASSAPTGSARSGAGDLNARAVHAVREHAAACRAGLS